MTIGPHEEAVGPEAPFYTSPLCRDAEVATAWAGQHKYGTRHKSDARRVVRTLKVICLLKSRIAWDSQDSVVSNQHGAFPILLNGMNARFCFCLREVENKQGRGRERGEGDRIPSRLHAISTEPSAGPNSQTVRSPSELKSRIRRLTDGATQGPRVHVF